MDYTKLNAKLANLKSLRRGTPMAKTRPEDEYSTWTEIYPFDEDVYVKLTIRQDSYGENEFIEGIQFVKPQVKQVTDFVTI
jgi:hypothetical protein